MIDINSFLKLNENELIVIINSMKETFSSHDFIEKFSQKFESDYIEMLVSYRDKNKGKAFQTVHSMIAKYLSLNMDIFHITKSERDSSENVFGSKDYVQWWNKF
jgi:hypothetical protein